MHLVQLESALPSVSLRRLVLLAEHLKALLTLSGEDLPLDEGGLQLGSALLATT
jgi:hypothetical protein